MSAAERSGRDHHAKGESWLGEHLGIQNFVGEAIADCLESAAILRIVLFCFSPTTFEGVSLMLTQKNPAGFRDRLVLSGSQSSCALHLPRKQRSSCSSSALKG